MFSLSDSMGLSLKDSLMNPFTEEGGGGGEPVSALDTFTDTDNTFLENHTADNGSTWSVHPDYVSAGKQLFISNNKLEMEDEGAAVVYINSTSVMSADCTVSAGFVVPVIGSSFRFGLVARMSPTVDTFYSAMFRFVDTRFVAVSILRLENGASSFVGNQTNLPDPPVAGKLYNMEFVLLGSSLKVILDGTTYIDITNSDVTAAGSVGIYANDLSADQVVTMDNFNVVES